jgi:hypothetical protein
MKLFSAMKLWMPLVGLGAFLAFAPQSRAQADVSPDHFDENGITGDFGHAKTSSPSAATVAQNQKPSAKAKAQTVSAKQSSTATAHQELVAVNDKSKVPPRKKNDQQ